MIAIDDATGCERLTVKFDKTDLFTNVMDVFGPKFLSNFVNKRYAITYLPPGDGPDNPGYFGITVLENSKEVI